MLKVEDQKTFDTWSPTFNALDLQFLASKVEDQEHLTLGLQLLTPKVETESLILWVFNFRFQKLKTKNIKF